MFVVGRASDFDCHNSTDRSPHSDASPHNRADANVSPTNGHAGPSNGHPSPTNAHYSASDTDRNGTTCNLDPRTAAHPDQPACAGQTHRSYRRGCGVHGGSRRETRRAGVSNRARCTQRAVLPFVHDASRHD